MSLIASNPIFAHTIGVSKGDYQLFGSEVKVELIFARLELMGVLPSLDTNHDGVIAESEVSASIPTINVMIVQGLIVQASSGPCVNAMQSATLTEEDGLLIRMVSRCPETPQRLSFMLTFLKSMSHGHRHLATMSVAGSTVQHAVAYAGLPGFDFSFARDTVGVPTWNLFRFGVEHILTGYDHLVFLLGLILVGGRLRSLLGAISAFTLAHSLTLGLAVLGVWAPSSTIVEPAIALSIAYIGVENYFVKDARRRWLITFPFGLIHGFGFAGALQEIALPSGDIPLALLSFNLGVEAGQIAILACVLPVLLWLRRQPWFAERGVRGTSAGITFAGVYWLIARLA